MKNINYFVTESLLLKLNIWRILETTLEMNTIFQLTPIAITAVAQSQELHLLSELNLLEQTLGYRFIDRKKLVQAITHNSFLNEYRSLHFLSYERMEFIGDALIGLIVARALYDRYPEESEGPLSKLRASIVHEKPLSDLATFLGFENFLLLGKGEYKARAYQLPSLKANLFESIIGAIYLDSGLEVAEVIFWKLVKKYESEKKVDLLSLQNLLSFDPKTRLQELTMSLFKSLPRYESKQVSHDLFTITLFINDKEIVSIQSNSKKRGESLVAELALSRRLYLSESKE